MLALLTPLEPFKFSSCSKIAPSAATLTKNGSSRKELRLSWRREAPPFCSPTRQGTLSFFSPTRMFVRSVWPKEAPNHIYPGAPEAGRARLYQLVVGIISLSKHFECYRVSIFVRATAWSAGARRRESSEPTRFICLGDPFGMISARSPSCVQLPARSWFPTPEAEWLTSKTYSHWGMTDAGLTADAWSGFPKLPVGELQRQLYPLGNIELVINFPIFVAPPATMRSFARYGSPPPPAQQTPGAPGPRELRPRIIASIAIGAAKLDHRAARPYRY